MTAPVLFLGLWWNDLVQLGRRGDGPFALVTGIGRRFRRRGIETRESKFLPFMRRHDPQDVLGRLFQRLYRSLPMYLAEAVPWTHPGDEQAAAACWPASWPTRGCYCQRIAERILPLPRPARPGRIPDGVHRSESAVARLFADRTGPLAEGRHPGDRAIASPSLPTGSRRPGAGAKRCWATPAGICNRWKNCSNGPTRRR